MANGQEQHPEQEIEKGKFEIGAAEFSVDAGSPLPEGYGDNRLVIMARDPFWFFAYWEITHERAEQIRVAHGRDSWDKAALVLRVYDLGESAQAPVDSTSHFDVEVNKSARQWYVQVPYSGHAYVADLGLRWPDGKFVSLFRSNVIRMPSGRVSDKVDSQWMSVGLVSEQRTWEDMAKIAIGAGSSKGGSASGEAGGGSAMALRWEFLRSVFSGSIPHGPSSWPSSRGWMSSSENAKDHKS
jgi:hypothetical protein